jgi:hypothetical protein
MIDYENSFQVGDWIGSVRRDECELLLSVYLVEPILPRVSGTQARARAAADVR